MNLKMSQWVAVRQSVLVAVFLAYLLNFVMQWIARKSNHQETSDRIRETRSKVFLFSLVGFFGCNLLQGGIFEAVAAWVVFIALATNHLLNFLIVDPQKRAISNLVFYLLLNVQAIGTVVHFIAQ